MTEPFFHSTGAIGDIIYSLPFCKQAAGESRFRYGIHYNVKSPYKGGLSAYGDYILSQAGARAVEPLLAAQPFVSGVELSESGFQGGFDLSMFRRLPLNLMGGDIRDWYYELSPEVLPRQHWKRWLSAEPSEETLGRVCVACTPRYFSLNVDWKVLEPWARKILFLGLPQEHEEFCRRFFKVEYRPTKDYLEAAGLIAGCSLFVSNPTGLAAVAEGLKVPRILVTCEVMASQAGPCFGPCNCNPLGGRCAKAATTGKLEASARWFLG